MALVDVPVNDGIPFLLGALGVFEDFGVSEHTMVF